jgi:tetratricopeptide (TPR) repeat protein
MIFNRHILRTEHWSVIASELFVSRRQFFRERRLLCDKLCSLLEAGSQSPSNTIFAQPTPEDLVYNDAALAYQSGNPNVADRILGELSALLPSGELRARALTLAAECAYDGLLFEVVLARCALAERAAAEIADFETRALASARVSLTRTRYFLGQADYDRARLEMEAALHKLSELSPPSDGRRSDLMRAILVRQAEIAIHMGDFRGALERIHRAKYALGQSGEASEATFDLASIEALMDTFAGRHQSALTTLTEASSLAQRLGFNRQILKLAVERAWYEFMVDRSRGRILAEQIAGLADAIRVPDSSLMPRFSAPPMNRRSMH